MAASAGSWRLQAPPMLPSNRAASYCKRHRKTAFEYRCLRDHFVFFIAVLNGTE